MLFHYTADAINDNWLHEAILEILVAGMDEIDAGRPLPSWPGCIPVNHIDVLSSKTGIRDHRQRFFEVFATLDQPSRDTVREALAAQNAIPDIFDGAGPCIRVEDLPVSIREPVNRLFNYAFGLLTTIGLRDTHYDIIWNNLTLGKICPFCGLERMRHPKQPRPDLDHYLSISKYPFAGANLRNLVPMGGDCNTAFKGQADMVLNVETNMRRRCCDPYAGPVFSVSLDGSSLFEEDETIRRLPAWEISFSGGDQERAATWDSVFQVKRRYSDVLNEEYHGWINHFGRWCADDRSGIDLTDAASVAIAIGRYIDTILQEGLADTNFLKRATFQMLRFKLEHDPSADRVAEWVVFVVEEFSSAVAT